VSTLRKPAPQKSKTAAAAVAVPQTREEVAEAIAAIGRHMRERARIEAAMGDEIAAVREAYERQAAPHAEAIRDLTEGVQTWCEAHRDALTDGRRVKTVAFTTGEVQWRMTPPRVVLKGVDALLALFKRRRLDQFIRVKEEISKEAILAERELVAGIPGVRIEQHEEFVITPHEAALQDVAP
jgi:phage host-nuclease inhibitor protein Gam